jgi:carbamoyltransferase
MAVVLGINAVFHDPAAALVVDGRIVACAEEERFSRRKHGKQSVPFSTWELPVDAARWCLAEAGLEPGDVDAVAYSYDPDLAPETSSLMAGEWEGLRTLYARRAPWFLATALPGLDTSRVRYVAHHVAHAASAYLASPHPESAVMVLDGRGERSSYLAGAADGRNFRPLVRQDLPHSLGLLYEDLTEHLGFHRSSDEYKVMGLAAYGEPRFLPAMRRAITTTAGRFHVREVSWEDFAPHAKGAWTDQHADLAASVQARLEEVLLELGGWLHDATGASALTIAGGVGLNCVANSRVWREGPFRDVWIQPAAGDAGTALGAALYVAAEHGDEIAPMSTAALGRGWTDGEVRDALATARVTHEAPGDLAGAVARLLADDQVVAWFQGRSEYGPRALGHRSLLADPRRRDNLERLNDVKGREQFRPLAPMVTLERAPDLFDGPLPSPYMTFTHRVREPWADKIPAVVHVDGTARIQTVDRNEEPLVAALLDAFDRLTGVPVLINTSLNTAGRPIVDSPRDVLELFGSTPVDALAIGPFLATRTPARRRAAA